MAMSAAHCLSEEGAIPNELPEVGRLPRRQGYVLVAEDDDAMRELIAGDLRHAGYAILEVRDGAELIDHIEAFVLGSGRGAAEAIAMLITDIRMPGVSGLDLLAALRRARSTIPVVLITAFGSEQVHRRARELDAVILDKPFDPERLRDVVRATVAPLPAALGA
jgi:DNA-binding response OmpR family regulator